MTQTWNIVHNDSPVWSRTMSEAIKVAGVVLVVGTGGVGKSSLALTLQQGRLPDDWQDKLTHVRKTKNLEFEFLSDHIQADGICYHISQQYLVPPGQRKKAEGELGRTYEDVIDIYRFHFRRVDVVLLSYMITQLESFNDIEEWIHLVNDLCSDDTNFILVGTHLDLETQREVLPTAVQVGKEYVESTVRALRPTWRGECTTLEVSSYNGANLDLLRRRISQAILRARQLVAARPLPLADCSHTNPA